MQSGCWLTTAFSRGPISGCRPGSAFWSARC
nr:MAG TPA: hypothetical protein [Caudoviricetes sp.]